MKLYSQVKTFWWIGENHNLRKYVYDFVDGKLIPSLQPGSIVIYHEGAGLGSQKMETSLMQ